MNYVDFKIPTTLAEARAILTELGDQAMPVAGSTLHVFLRDESPKVGVDISRLGLGQITDAGDHYAIGATTTVADLHAFNAPDWVLDRVAQAFVTQPIRNIATIGGSVVRVFPWSDWPIPLLALDAEFVISGDEERVMSAKDFFARQPFHHLQPGDILTSVRTPKQQPNQGFGYFKERRTTTDFSRCTVAAWVSIEEGLLADARIAIGAAVPMPIRMEAIESALRGVTPSAAKIEAAVRNGLEGVRWKGLHGISDDYALHLAAVRIVDALQSACDEATAQTINQTGEQI